MNTSDSTMEKILSNQLKMVDYISLALNQQAVLFKEVDNLKGRLSELEKAQVATNHSKNIPELAEIRAQIVSMGEKLDGQALPPGYMEVSMVTDCQLPEPPRSKTPAQDRLARVKTSAKPSF